MAVNGVSGKSVVRKRRITDDSGMTAIEFVILTPMMFLILMLTVQFAMYLFAKQAATAAVQAGARVAREEAAANGCAGPGNSVDRLGWANGLVWQRDAGKAVGDRAAALGGKLLTIDAASPGGGITVDGTYTPNPNQTVACQLSVVTVTLTADPPSIVPFWQPQIKVQSGGPLEQGVRHQ